jgi:uncharacterized protein (TIGR02594 family)
VSSTSDPPWLAEAERLLRRQTPRGLSRADRLRWIGWIDRRLPVSLPWCGLFVAHCLRTALPGIEMPRPRFRARPWEAWGEHCAPQIGAVMVFWHYHRRAPFGHVGFYWAEDRDSFHILGGNQRNRVTVEAWPKSRLTACRWPAGQPRPGLRQYLARGAQP